MRYGFSPWGGRGTNSCFAAPKKKTVSTPYCHLEEVNGPTVGPAKQQTLVAYWMLAIQICCFSLPGPTAHFPTLLTVCTPHHRPSPGSYCLHCVHSSLCLSVPITSHWDSRLPTGESLIYHSETYLLVRVLIFCSDCANCPSLACNAYRTSSF